MKQHLAPWGVKVYRRCGEAVIWRKTEPAPSLKERGNAKDPERARREASRRRATKVRRLCIENGIDRLWTLTYKVEPADRDTVVHDLDVFLKRVRRRWPRLRFVWTIEVGEKNGRLHVHLGADRFIAKASLAECWGHGFVDARRLRRSDSGNDPRSTARYLSKYVGKQCGGSTDSVLFNRRRYGRSANCTLTHDDYEADGEVGAERLCVLLMGGRQPQYVWRSSSEEEWRGPPVAVAFW